MLMWAGFIFLAIFLQSAFFGMLPFLEIKPDLILIMVMYAAFFGGVKRGTAVGFVGGFAEDFVSGGLLGANALVKALLGYCLGSLRKKFEYKSRSFQFISVFAVSCFSQTAVFFIMQISGHSIGLHFFGDLLFPVSLLNAALGPFVFRLLEGVMKYDR